MPLVRFKIRNELSLGGSELNRSAAVENEEPKEILNAVEVAGLVGILRQLGDLAEFSAEVFNGIQEEVTVTTSRFQKLTSRVRRIESALSPLEKAVLSQTSHIHFVYTAGCEWHSRIRNVQRHFVQSDLPLCVMETYEQCRDPPPLHLLDRFDVGGPGSCLRKYSDPTFFRKEISNPCKADDVKVQRDQAHRKRKKKRLPQRNIFRSHSVSTSNETNGARLSSLSDDRQTHSQSTSTVDMPRSSDMQDLSDIIDQSHLQGQSDAQEQSEAQVQSDFQESSRTRDSITGSGYIEYVINQSSVNKPDVKLLEGFLPSSLQPADRIGSAVPEGCIEVVDDNILYSSSEDIHVPCASIVCDEKKETLESMVEKSSKDEEAQEIHKSKFGPGTPDRVRQNQRDFDRTHIFFDEVDIVGEKKSKSQTNSINGKPGTENEGETKSEQGSEADEFEDARNTIESESESEVDGVPKPKLEHYFGDISTYCSEDFNSDKNDGSEDTTYEHKGEDPRHDNSLSLDEFFSGSYLSEAANVSCCMSPDEIFQKPMEFSALCSSLLAEEAFPDGTILREEPISAHPLSAGDYSDEKILSEEPISSSMSPKDAIPAENISPEEHLATYPSLAAAVPHEKIFPGESVAKYPSFAEIVPHEMIFPEKSLPKIQSSAEAVPDDMTPAEEPDATHTSFPKAVQDKKISAEVLDLEKFSVPQAVLQEKISLEEFVGIYPCLAEADPDESFTQERSTTCLSFTKAMPIEKSLPEESLEADHCLTELPKENILQEKPVDFTHPSCAKAGSEANVSPEVLDSTNLSVAGVLQEQISLEEFVGINMCSSEAVPNERFLPDKSVTTSPSKTKAMAIEKILPEELLGTYLLVAKLPEEKILLEETDDATHPSEAVSDENIPPEVSHHRNLSQEEVHPQDKISLEENFGISPCLSEEPDTTCLSLTKAAAEKPLETYPSLADFPEEKILHEEADDATTCRSLSETVSDEQISPEVLDSTNLPVAEAVPQEKILLEFIGIDPCVLDKRVLPEEHVTTCMSLTKAVPIEEVFPEEPLEAYASLEKLPKDEISQEKSDDATYPSCVKAESDENVSPEVLDSTYLSVAEAMPQEQITLEEFVDIVPCLAEAVPDERVLPEEPVITCLSLKNALPIEKMWSDKSLEVYPSLEESPEENILQEEEPIKATHPSFSEALCEEKISPLEDPSDSTYPSLEDSAQHEKTSHDELVGTNPFSDLTVPNERSFPDEHGFTNQSSAEAVLKEKNLPEEPLPTRYPSLAEAVTDEKISLEEPNATCPPSAETVFDEKILELEIPGSTTETDPHNKTFPEEHVATDLSLAEPVPNDNILPKEPAAAHLDLADGIPDQKVFLDDAAFLSFAEAIFDQKFSPEVPDSMYPSLIEPEVPVFPPSMATDLPSKNIMVKEGESFDESNTESDDRTIPLSGGTVTIHPDTQESLSIDTSVESVSIWSNGGLLGLAPSKPPVFTGPTTVSEHIQNETSKASVLATRKQESCSGSVEDTAKSPLSLVVSDPTSQQQSNRLSHSNGSHSHLQSTATSFKVFGLSHRLLMAGFRGNSSSTFKFESLPSTKVAAIEDKTQQTPNGSSFEEQLDYESSLFGSPTSSPPVEHMKISFNPIDSSPVTKLKLRIPFQPQYKGEYADMFPSFQLVPEASNSDGDDISEIFCQSSPCVSDYGLSDSELWESDESPRKSVSSLDHDINGDMGSFSGSFLDLPCFDTVDHESKSSRIDQEQEQVPEYKPSVSEIIRDWPPNQPKHSNEAEANANAVLKKTLNQNVGL